MLRPSSSIRLIPPELIHPPGLISTLSIYKLTMNVRSTQTVNMKLHHECHKLIHKLWMYNPTINVAYTYIPCQYKTLRWMCQTYTYTLNIYPPWMCHKHTQTANIQTYHQCPKHITTLWIYNPTMTEPHIYIH